MPPFVEEGLVSLVGEIYAAVENPALWPAVLDRLARIVDGDSVWLVANYANSIAQDVSAFAGDNAAILAPYREHYAAVNVWTERCDRLFPAGQVRYSHWAIPDRDLEATEFYDGWLRPNGIGYGFGVEIALPNQPSALLSSMRSPRRGPFEESQGRLLKALLPHFQRALRLHFELAMLRSNNQGLELALDAFDRAVIGLNGKGKILFCNRTARQLLTEADGLRSRENCLVARQPAQNTQLQYLLTQAAVAGTGFSATGALLIDRKSGRPALRLTLMPFAGNFLGHVPGLATLVFVDDPTGKPVSRASVLRKLFRLSPAEIRLAEMLAEGISLSTAANRLNVTSETARHHLKSIFNKAGVRRQVDLVRLVLNLPGHTVAPAAGKQ
jgi:DNA-binding CsgD family transcriptional regulator/PAS domain-containing protein